MYVRQAVELRVLVAISGPLLLLQVNNYYIPYCDVCFLSCCSVTFSANGDFDSLSQL